MELAIPRYLWVYNSLKSQMESEDYKVGDFLPPEPELQKTFHVSRTTVRKAVEMLAQQGFVYIRQGKGTQVLDFKATQKLGFVTSFSETLREKGATVTQADVRIDFVAAPRRIATDLQIEANAPLVKIDRVTMANGTPIALMTNYLLPSIAPGIEKRIGGMSGLYSFLESEFNLVIEAATDFITARDVTEAEAERLQIPPHSPLLVVRRITHSGGRPIEVAILLVVADKYEYCVHTKDRPPRGADRPPLGAERTPLGAERPGARPPAEAGSAAE
jgi:GntR family transcriptional regulator